MKLAYQTNGWGGVVGHPAGVTSVKDLYYLAGGSTEQAISEIGAAGYGGVELFDGNLVQYAGREAELRALMEGAGVRLVGVYAGANFIYPDVLDDELSKIAVGAQLGAQLGAEHLVVGGGAVRAGGTRPDDYRRLGEGLERVAALAREHGLTPSFHPHLGTCVETPEQIAYTFEHTGINFCPDTAHLYAAGGDPAALIHQYAERIRLVHLKDFRAGQFLPLGEGELDMPAILAALRAIGYDGWIGVELDGYAGSPGEGARSSRRFLEAHVR